MDFSFDSIAIVPELICLFIIPEYIRVIFPKNLFREGLGVGLYSARKFAGAYFVANSSELKLFLLLVKMLL